MIFFQGDSGKNYEDEPNDLEARLPADYQSIRSNIVDTKFSCEDKEPGYYADVDNDCQVSCFILNLEVLIFLAIYFEFKSVELIFHNFLDFPPLHRRIQPRLLLYLPPGDSLRPTKPCLRLERHVQLPLREF